MKFCQEGDTLISVLIENRPEDASNKNKEVINCFINTLDFIFEKLGSIENSDDLCQIFDKFDDDFINWVNEIADDPDNLNSGAACQFSAKYFIREDE